MMEGHAMKQALEWERTRFLAFTIARTVTNKVKRPSDILTIPLLDVGDEEDMELIKQKFKAQAEKVNKLIQSGGGIKPTVKNGKRKVIHNN